MVLSIDISENRICAVEGQATAGKITVLRTAELAIDSNAVIDDGMVKNQVHLSAVLNRLRDAGCFLSKRAIVTFTSSTILLRRLELPNAKPKEITRMARNEMLQIVGNAEDYVYDCSSIAEGLQSDICVVWAYAVPQDMVEGYLQALSGAALKPMALDVHANSIEKLFLHASVNGGIPGRALLFVELEESGLDIHLFAGGERAFSRFSPVSASELGMLLKNAGLYTQENTPLGGVDLADKAIHDDTILRDATQRYFASLAEELRKIIQFQQRRNARDPVSGIYIYGGLAHVNGVDVGLGEALGLPVEVVKTVSNVNAPAGFAPANYINALGALIRVR